MGDSSSNLASILDDQEICHRRVRETFLSRSQLLLSNFSVQKFDDGSYSSRDACGSCSTAFETSGPPDSMDGEWGMWDESREEKEDLSHRMATLVLLQRALRGG